MRPTGVYLTEEEFERVSALVEAARQTPVVWFGSGPSLAAVAWRRVQDELYLTALGRGLPEIAGYYGLDAERQLVAP